MIRCSSVRTSTLDHGTPVQAYAFESKAKFNIDNTALKAHGSRCRSLAEPAEAAYRCRR